MIRSRPRGFVLPFVLLAVAAATTVVFTLVSEGWHSVRAVRLAARGNEALAAAEEAQAVALSQWERDSLWAYPPGRVVRRRIVTAAGVGVELSWQRTHPLVAVLRTQRTVAGNARHTAVQRDLLRPVWLVLPALPVQAALTVAGTVSGRAGSLISGSDLPMASSVCGLVRDSASVPPVAADGVVEDPVGSWPGPPTRIPVRGIVADSVTAVLPAIRRRATEMAVGSLAVTLPTRTDWHALVLTGPRVVLEGPVHWRGLLVIDGALEIRGQVEIEGLLVVRGALDARAGQLEVQGAVLGADPLSGGIQLGANAKVLYDRCALLMALATVSRVSLNPFALWQPLSR